jgi:outer membrane protein assembly factor BamB
MNVITKALSLAAPITLGLVLAAGAAETPAAKSGPAWGAADVQPTPENPVYFRWCQGYFPGATPPLEWWEGTPEQVDGEVWSESQRKVVKTKVWRFADQKSKNILWKAPAGGWGLSHPIVVGTKVFSVGVPDVITCNDLATGKQLWQKRAMPLLMDGVPEEKAAAAQKVFDLVRALWLIGSGDHGANPDCIGLGGGNNHPEDAKFLKGGLEGEELKRLLARKRESVAKVIRMIQAHRGEVAAAGEADLVTALDADLAELEAWFKMDDAAFAKELATRKNRGDNIRTACMKKYQVPFTTEWSGYVGVADSTLASDGRFIYGAFDQGQTFCYDLDGNLKWGVREKGQWDTRGTFHSSPTLCDGVLVVKKRTSHKKTGLCWIGLDAATGKQLWEANMGISNYLVPKLMRLTGPDGATVSVLIGDTAMEKGPDNVSIHPALKGQAIVRVRDGRILGYLPNFATGRGAIMTVHGDLVTGYSYADNFGGPDMAFRVRMTGPDTAAGEVVWSHTGKEPRVLRYGGFPTQLGDYLRNGYELICDVRDGSRVASLERVRWSDDAAGVLAGRHLIFWTEANPGSNSPYRNAAAQPEAMLRFHIFDLSDPKNPKPVANNNLIGFKEPPADLVVRTYLKEFDPYGFMGCYKGTASYCAMMGGPVAVGNKLLIQTSAFLYCIGEK